MQIIWLITTTLTLVLSTEATKENMYATTIASVMLYRFLRVGCQSYKNSECDSRENQPMIGGQTFSNSYEVSDWLFFTSLATYHWLVFT